MTTATKERRSSPAVTGELANMAGDDERETQDSAAADYLEQLEQFYGPDHLIPESEWRYLTPEFTNALRVAVEKRQLAETIAHRYVGGKHFNIHGLRVGDVIRWLRGEKCQASPAGHVVLTLSIDEGLSYCSELMEMLQVHRTLGIRPETLFEAIKASKIRNEGGASASVGRISRDGLREWLIAQKIQPKWTPGFAARIARERTAKEIAEADSLAMPAPAPRRPVRSYAALEALKAAENEDASNETKSRATMLETYRAILARRENPIPSDRGDLIAVCTELALTSARVAADIDVLDTIAELEALIPQLASREVALCEAQKERRKFPANADARDPRLIEAKRRVSFTQGEFNDAVGAPKRIEELKASNPRLFPASR